MLATTATVNLVLCGALALVAAHRLWRDRIVDNTVIVIAGLSELAQLALLAVGVSVSGQIADGAQRATFIAYLVTILIVLPLAVFLSVKERSRWGMGVVLAAAFVVAVLIARILQIWSARA